MKNFGKRVKHHLLQKRINRNIKPNKGMAMKLIKSEPITKQEFRYDNDDFRIVVNTENKKVSNFFISFKIAHPRNFADSSMDKKQLTNIRDILTEILNQTE